MRVTLPSGHYLLEPADFDKFRPGTAKRDVLEDVQWRGNFEMATEDEGKSVCAISFGILGGPHSSGGGTSVWAIFVDNKFQKFVEWPHWSERPIKVGDFSRLVRGLKGDAVDIRALDREGRSKPVPGRTGGDPFVAKELLRAKARTESRREKELRRNAELRDQFNAARLRIGMAEMEVESVLKAEPIEVGNVAAGTYKVYGSTEVFDMLHELHYSNVLVLFRQGKATGIYSGFTVPGGVYGLQSLKAPVVIDGLERQSFVDLPLLKRQ